MKLLSLAILFACVSAGRAQQPDVKPGAAKAAARVQKLLDPANIVEVRVFAAPLSTRVGAAKVEPPEPGIPVSGAVLPDVPAPALKGIRPRVSAEPSPLAMSVPDSAPPIAVVMPEEPLAKQSGVDVHVPPPLPALGVYVKDRVSLADPSWDISGQLILAPQSPARENLVPFSPWNLPDPFENLIVRLREAWAENFELPKLSASTK